MVKVLQVRHYYDSYVETNGLATNMPSFVVEKTTP